LNESWLIQEYLEESNKNREKVLYFFRALTDKSLKGKKNYFFKVGTIDIEDKELNTYILLVF
jgi:hypothetical protein